MAERDMADFTFDVSGFNAAMKTIVGGMGNIEKAIKSGAGTSEKHIGGALLKFNVLWSVITSSFRGFSNIIKENIPEIGQTFDIAKNIIMKNLLWPLRKELIPILNQVLRWVTDNRAMFVQLGSVLVNVFRLVKTLFTTILSLLKPIMDVIKEEMRSIFGDTAKSIADTLNLITLKITATIIYFRSVLRPVFVEIGGIVKSAIDDIRGFFDALTQGAGGAGSAINAIDLLKDSLIGIKEALIIIKPTLEMIGRAVGSVFQMAGLDLQAIKDIKETGSIRTETREKASAVGYKSKVEEQIKKGGGPTGQQLLMPGRGGSTINMNFGDINLHSSAVSSKEDANILADELDKRIKDKLIKDRVLQGAQ